MIITPLLPHQEVCRYNLFDKRVWKAALFQKPGSGKSLVSMYMYESYLRNTHQPFRLLITSDKNNTVNTWGDQIARHTDWFDTCDVLVRPRNLKDLPSNVVVITNYDQLPTMCQQLCACGFTGWIGDESSEFKDGRTHKAQALKRIVANVDFRIILNGTPVTEHLEDIFQQIRMLDDKVLGSTLTQFRTRYMQPDQFGYGWEPRRNSLTDIQRATADITDWTVCDVVMPQVVRWNIRVDKTQEQMKLDNDLKEEFAATLSGSKIEEKHAASLFIKRLELTGGIFAGDTRTRIPTNKTKTVRRLIEENKSMKIVVWHTYVMETDILTDALRGLRVYKYTDASDTKDIEKFRDMKHGGVLLIRNSMCKGLNQLANADMAVYYSLPLSYRSRAQSEGRTRRIGSLNDVTYVVDLITKGGVDEIVYNQLRNKKDVGLMLTNLRNYV